MSKDPERKDRLKQALRANLRRRKSQSKERQETNTSEDDTVESPEE